MVGILIEAKLKGHLERIKPSLNDLVNIAGFRISDSLFRQVLRTAGE